MKPSLTLSRLLIHYCDTIKLSSIGYTISCFALSYIYYRCGCEHEEDAFEAYTKRANEYHHNVSAIQTGFFMQTNLTLECDSCGHVVIKVKCSLCIKDQIPEVQFDGFV